MAQELGSAQCLSPATVPRVRSPSTVGRHSATTSTPFISRFRRMPDSEPDTSPRWTPRHSPPSPTFNSSIREEGPATISTDSSATPMIGPDGDVYFGVLESPCCSSHNARGWMLHFDSTLTQTKTPGSFGWDDTASVVPSSAVPSYAGTSPYLILTKYNNYVNTGTGDGINKVAILDPFATMPGRLLLHACRRNEGSHHRHRRNSQSIRRLPERRP